MDDQRIEKGFLTSPLIAELLEIAVSGDTGRLESTAKRQHFVPQLVLRRFRDPLKLKRIYQLNVTSGKPTSTTVESAASRRHLYRLTEADGTLSNRLDGFLERIESHAAPALDRLIEDAARVTDEDRVALAFFFAMQMQRTPAAAAQITNIANTVLRALAGSELFADRKEFAERYREHVRLEGTDEEAEEFRLETIAALRSGDVVVSNANGAAFAEGIRHALTQAVILLRLEWTILKCPGAFVTSDRAMAIHDPTLPYPWSSQALLSSPQAETTIPLSVDACLLIRPRQPRIGTQEIAKAEAMAINLRTYGWADRYIYGPSQDSVVSVRREAKARPSDIVRPRPQHQVLFIDADPDDDSFARENAARGWPPRLVHEGSEKDYVVIPHDQPAPHLHARIEEAIDRRMRKKLGIPDGEPLPGQMETRPVHPLSVR